MSPDFSKELGIVTPCPECRRVIWTHGSCPSCHPPSPPKEALLNPPKYPEYKPKTRDKKS